MAMSFGRARFGLLRRGILGAKLALPKPTGIKLSDAEAGYIIDDWKDQRQSLYKDVEKMKTLATDVEERLQDISKQFPTAREQFNQAKRNYRSSKDPIKKRQWATKLVIRSRYHDYLIQSRTTMEATTERIRETVEDSSVAYNLLAERIKDAELYRSLNGGMQLVGKALIDAKSQARITSPDIEFSSLEFTLEKLEREIGGKQDDNLITEADALLAKRDTLNDRQ